MDAFIGLGANLGDPLAQLRAAARALKGSVGTVRAYSAVYRTAPVGGPGPEYLNAAVRLETPLTPQALVVALQAIEAAAGRARIAGQQNAPRILDLDLLLLGERGELVLDLPGPPQLVVPHPRLHGRAFALKPLCDLAPELCHPVLGRTLRELLVAALAADAAQGLPPPRPIEGGLPTA
jgi:2-amino-4-hydroxy-6-hydroxymethyldihydropteridine diphosphokinase